MNKWVERAAMVTGTLGFIGVLIVCFNTINSHRESKRNKESIVTTPSAKKVSSDSANMEKEVLNDSVIDKEAEKIIVEDEKRNIAVKRDTIKTIGTEKEKARKQLTVSKTELPKGLNRQQMLDIYRAIKRRSITYGNVYNCVQLQSVEGANNLKAMTQVGKFLRAKKITITGREIITSSRKGIYIKSKGNCITVVIGPLE